MSSAAGNPATQSALVGAASHNATAGAPANNAANSMAQSWLAGDFLDPLAAILVFVPLLLPTLAALQIDPIWFGIILVINMELANITPPVGLNLFIIQAIEPSITYAEVFRGTVPFMIVIVILLTIVLLFPQLALWLPARL